MATTPLRKCGHGGCSQLVREGNRCEQHTKRVSEIVRLKTSERGYGWRWQKVSEQYRNENPLCVECLFKNKVTAVQCVDHIIPHYNREKLLWDYENFCALCWQCHNRKTMLESELMQWEPRDSRLVICGLPATGKTTRAELYAEQFSCDVFDWDKEAEARGIEVTRQDEIDLLMRVRRDWLIKHRHGSAVMIVSRPYTALQIAANMEAKVIHCVCDETTRHGRVRAREKALTNVVA